MPCGPSPSFCSSLRSCSCWPADGSGRMAPITSVKSRRRVLHVGRYWLAERLPKERISMASITEPRTLPSPQPRGKALATRRARARVADRVITGLLWVLVSTVVALLAYFILYTISQGLGVLSWDFITSSNAAGNLDGPEVFNTFYILVLALLVCAPIGIFGAVYLVEYARQNAFTAVV